MARFAHDPLAVRALNPKFETFPDSSLVDFSFLLDAPAGKDGWLEARSDGHFYFSDSGRRARFWGTTVAADNVDIPKDKITEVVDVLARGGCNMLRLHELDNRGAEKYNLVRRSVIDESFPNHDRSTELDPEYQDRIDWWIAEAQERGVYVYLVLRGYRTFRAGDGVDAADKLDRSAKPYSFFDSRLIELQKQYADTWLFDHVNPHTGAPNGLNPAVCMIEIENEDSLFAFYNISEKRWRGMIEPYRGRFAAMWNAWLRDRYGSTDKLRAAWTNERGECPLGPDERLEDGTVELPAMSETTLDKIDAIAWADALDSPARSRDGARFAVDVQRRYFAAMRDHLRSRGCRALFTAVVDTHTFCDTWSVGAELDFTAQNAYQDHPSFAAGQTWMGRQSFTNANYLKRTNVWSLGPIMASWKWAGKPWFVREWTTCWPNASRVSSMLDIAAQACLQDYDGLTHFDYKTWGNPDMISTFGMQCDPARWGMNGYAALLFLRGDLEPIRQTIALDYSEADLTTWAGHMTALDKLAWMFRVEHRGPGAPDDEYLARITSGRAGIGGEKDDGSAAATRRVVRDARYRARAEGRISEAGRGVLAATGYDFPWTYRAEGFPVEAVRGAGFMPVMIDADGANCRAFLDEKRRNLVLGPVEPNEAFLAAWRFAQILEGKAPPAPETFAQAEPATFEAPGRARDSEAGVLRIAAPRFCAIAGELPVGAAQQAGDLTVESASPIAGVAAASLDGRPLAQSRRFAIKMATVADNRAQKLVEAPEANRDAPFVLDSLGLPPVQTQGKASDRPTRVALAGRPVVAAYLTNGAWEILVDLDRRETRLFCDTPNVRFALGPSLFGQTETKSPAVRSRAFFYEYPPRDTGQHGSDIIYPGWSKYVELKAE